MISRMLNFIRDEHDNDPSFILLTRNIVIYVIGVNIALLFLVTGIFGEDSRNPRAFITLSITLVLELISLYYAVRGRVLLAKVIVPTSLIIAVGVISLTTNGLKNSGMVGLPIILVIAAILLGRRAFVIITPLAVITTIVVAYFDLPGNIIKFVPAGIDDAIILPVLLLGCSGIIQLLMNRLNENIIKARQSERNYVTENQALVELQTSLENRVAQRTLELERANRNNERRARQFEAVAQVSSIISNIQDFETLIVKITQVISEQFEHYHTGIFLLDETREFAILRAANSMGGQRMLARNHKLQVGQTGIVGFVTATGTPRIALDVGTDAVFFDNPDLPATRSEIALPLLIGTQVIGALDVQSEKENAFSSDDISVLGTLANQVSIAIQNTRNIEDARKSLAEAQSAYSESIQQAWKVMRPQSLGAGLQWSESTIKQLDNPLQDEHIQRTFAQGLTTVVSSPFGKLAIPIRIRGQVIGVMSLNNKNGSKWSEDDIDIAEAIAERLSLAIETATLLRTTQQRADIEKITTEITSKISSSSRFDTILQTAAQELSKALGGSDVLVQIEPAALKLGMSE
jgi:GAF domain-containing protein